MQQTTSRDRLAIAAVVLAVLAIVAWVLLRDAPARRSDDDVGAVLDRMDAMEARLHAEQQATRRELDTLRASGRGGSSELAARRPEDPLPSPEQMVRKTAQQAETQRRELETLFQALGPPPARDKAPQQLDQAFAYRGVREAPVLPASQQVECRSTMCMVSAQFPPYQDGSEWADRVLMQVGQTLPNARIVSVSLPGGGNELRIYAARSNVRDPFGRSTALPGR